MLFLHYVMSDSTDPYPGMRSRDPPAEFIIDDQGRFKAGEANASTYARIWV